MKIKLKTIAFAAPTKWVKNLVKGIKEAGYKVEEDYKDGTVTAYMDGEVVFRAMEMNRGFWMTRGVEGMFTEVS